MLNYHALPWTSARHPFVPASSAKAPSNTSNYTSIYPFFFPTQCHEHSLLTGTLGSKQADSAFSPCSRHWRLGAGCTWPRKDIRRGQRPRGRLQGLMSDAVTVEERCQAWVGFESTMTVLVMSLVIGTGRYGRVGTISVFSFEEKHSSTVLWKVGWRSQLVVACNLPLRPF